MKLPRKVIEYFDTLNRVGDAYSACKEMDIPLWKGTEFSSNKSYKKAYNEYLKEQRRKVLMLKKIKKGIARKREDSTKCSHCQWTFNGYSACCLPVCMKEKRCVLNEQ